MQNEILHNASSNQNEFWKSIERVGDRDNRQKGIPMEVVDQNSNVMKDSSKVFDKWKTEFSGLLNPSDEQQPDLSQIDTIQNINFDADEDASLAREFSILDVQRAVCNIKNNRAAGVDEIPGEVLKNGSVISFLHKLCNLCFDTGKVPDIWCKSVISPIPKCTTSDPRDPLSYRGISITPVVYKVYCSLLNDRVMAWSEHNNLIYEGQNGFRKGRSTIDHISSLTQIIETRKKLKMSTFCAFIDFKKAYDSINRDILWHKLEHFKLNNKLLGAIKSIYKNVLCSVKLNGFLTDWFGVKSGLKRGCSLSPVLFNLYINDLALKINALGKGIKIDDESISILLYADDVVLLAENETDLQCMLNVLGNWCNTNKLFINSSKSNIVHFRNPSKTKSNFAFKVNDETIEYASHYKYLGLVLSEHLDFAFNNSQSCITVCKQSSWIVNCKNESIWWSSVRCIY